MAGNDFSAKTGGGGGGDGFCALEGLTRSARTAYPRRNGRKRVFRRRRAAAAAATAFGEGRGRRPTLGIQLAVGPQPLWLRNHNSRTAQRIMVKRLATSPHDPLGITDSACKNQLVVVSVQYGPFNPYIPIRSTTIGKSRVAIDPIAMHTSWRSNSDIASVTSIGYPRMSASGESSTTMHRLLHASGSHPIPTPYDPNYLTLRKLISSSRAFLLSCALYLQIILFSGILLFDILSEMASSFITNALQINFDYVLGIQDNEGMVNMFKALEDSGLRGFLGWPSVLCEQELAQFFDTAIVQDGDITCAVSGKYVEISESTFAGVFNLPTDGLTDLSEVPNHLAAVDSPIRSMTGFKCSSNQPSTRKLMEFWHDRKTSRRGDQNKSDHEAGGGRRRKAAANRPNGLGSYPGIQLAVGPQPLRLQNHNFELAHRIMLKRLATSPHDPLSITDSAYSIGYPRMRASGESSTTIHRLLHASGSHPIPPPNDPK
ncbi:hypothetical protein F511_03546 [Dorcoceras hygrometricum]|uniref:Uncharacterized protein n=1 Tax=Dorcoceras hygrometricum TaxID=472368 RepID=A0A2Z7BQB3_9LAMI|nr:hypothetical protein F511_03546 [Dorcoceras hygrometricum]